jgi:hypothetical protein
LEFRRATKSREEKLGMWIRNCAFAHPKGSNEGIPT